MKNENVTGIKEIETNPSPEHENGYDPSSNPQTRTQCVNRKSEIENSSDGRKSEIVNSSRSSTGKIARLPAALRDQVNQWLDDGTQLETICNRLAELGHPGITYHNVSRWKANGYQKHVRFEEHLDEERIRFETAHKLGQELGDSSQASRTCEIITPTRIYELLLSLNTTSDPEESAETIKQVCQLTRALGIHLSHRSRRDRLQFQERLLECKLTRHEGPGPTTPRNPDDPARSRARVCLQTR